MRTVLFALLMLFAGLVGAQPYVIDSFDVKIQLHKAGDMDVEERIAVTFNESRRGIFRFIPVDYQTGKGFNRRILIDQIMVSDDRSNVQTTKVTREGPNVKIRIGDEDVFLPAGTSKTYIIRYRCRGMMNWFEESDGWGPTSELYWNVTGDEWETPIRRASCLVEFPAAPDGKGLRAKVFAGPYGSRLSQVIHTLNTPETGTETQTTATLGSSSFEVKRTVELPSYSGLTVVLDMPGDLIDQPTLAQHVADLLRANLGFLLPLFFLPILLFIWHLHGKDPVAGPIVTQFDPPDGISGPAAGTLLDERVDTRDISAGIFSLAVKGYLTIEPDEEGFLIKRRTAKIHVIREDRGGDLSAFEGMLLSRLRAAGPTVDDSDLRQHVAPHLTELRGALYEELVDKGYYVTNPETSRVVSFLVGAACVVVAGFIATALTPYRSPLPAVVGGVISLIMVGFFAKGMPRRTKQGSIAQANVAGFEEFVRRAKGDEIDWMAAKHPDAALFEKYLPHAIAFGLAREWGARFEGIVTEPPRWYVSPYGYHGFHPMYFSRDIGTISDSIGSAAATPPRSSGASGGGSGFGGGGFSGGGFGGGGGGSW